MKPILKYPGAKWALASWIVRYLPETPHYVEPFCGSAAVYFNLPWRPRHAVLNDLSGDVVNFFRIIRERGPDLARLVEATPWSRAEFEATMGARGVTVLSGDPLEDARRFLVRTWQGFGARLNMRTGWAHGGNTGKSQVQIWRDMPERIRVVAEALMWAEIESMPAVDLVRRVATPDALLYVDPPYVLDTRCDKGVYQHEMTDAEHLALLDALDAHPGPVALSGYAHPIYDDRLTHWRRVETQAQAEKGNTRTECLWLNPVLQSRLSLGPLFDYATEAA